MPTLSQLITDTSYLLGDPPGNRWKTAISGSGVTPVLGTNDIQYLLNEACDLYNSLTGVYHTMLPLQVVANTATVPILDASGSPPYGKLLRVEDNTGMALIESSEGDMNLAVGDNWQSYTPSQPRRFMRGLDSFGTIRLWPTPPINSTFKAYVVGRPIPMLASSDLPFIGAGPNREATPAHHHYALPFYAAYKCLLWNRASQDVQTAKEYQAEFMKRAEQGAAEVKAALSP